MKHQTQCHYMRLLTRTINVTTKFFIYQIIIISAIIFFYFSCMIKSSPLNRPRSPKGGVEVWLYSELDMGGCFNVGNDPVPFGWVPVVPIQRVPVARGPVWPSVEDLATTGIFSILLYSVCTLSVLVSFSRLSCIFPFVRIYKTPGGIRTRNSSKRSAAHPHLRPLGHWDSIPGPFSP